MRLSSRVDLPQYSEFFRTEYDEQHNVGALEAHYSIICAPLLAKPDSPIELQRLAVIWDQDHDERVIALLEAAYFQGLLAPSIFCIAEHKGHVAVITNGDLGESERQRQSRFWQRISDDVIVDDKFVVNVMLEEEYILELSPRLRSTFKTYFEHIDNAWTLGPNAYQPRPAASRRENLLSSGPRLKKSSW